MQDTMTERTATQLELARETARGIPCECGALTGYSCDTTGGMHLSRFAQARILGLLSEPRMAAALDAAGDVFTPGTLIPGGAR